MAKIKQPELPFKEPYKPFFKTQNYHIEVKFLSKGIVLGGDIVPGMLVGKGVFGWVEKVSEVIKEDGRLIISFAGSPVKSYSNKYEEWDYFEIVKQGTLDL